MYLSLLQKLIRARTCVQRGQVDAAIKLYRGLLVSFAHHPQVNADLGLLLLQHRSAQEAIPYLNRAVAALPTAFQHWVCLVIAHQLCGDLVSAREVLAQMHALGFDAAQLAVYEQELNEPTPEAVLMVLLGCSIKNKLVITVLYQLATALAWLAESPE